MVDRILIERVLTDIRSHYYERVDDETVYGIFKQNLSDFDLFVKRIVEYLDRIEKNGEDRGI